jgi:hypothetical protein
VIAGGARGEDGGRREVIVVLIAREKVCKGFSQLFRIAWVRAFAVAGK